MIIAFYINACRFIDVKQASALYRLLGDEARLRLLRVLAPRAPQRHRADRRPRPGAVGRLAASRPAQGRRARRRGEGRRLQLLPPVAGARDGGDAALATMLARAVRAVRGATRRSAPTMRGCRKCCGCGRRTSTRTRGPDTRDARQLVPGRSWAAWSRALGLLLPPLTVADLGCGEGYLTIEAARWASRVIAVDRSDAVLERARGAGARGAACRTSIWKRGELEQLPIRDAAVDVALLSQALHHAHEPGARRRRGGADHGARRPRAGARSARAPGRLGPRQARRPAPRVRRRRAEAHADRRRAARREGRRRRAQGRRSVHRADCVRDEAATAPKTRKHERTRENTKTCQGHR